jgi:peptide/nickel transport system permease protein
MAGVRSVLGRVAQYGLVLAFALMANFTIPRLAPGDPLIGIVGESGALLPPSEQQAIIHRVGLDRPIVVQFGRYLGRLAHGDLGYSYNKGRPVSDVIRERLPFTLLLLVPAALASAAVGIGLGVRAAWRHGTKTDVGLLGLVLGVEALPAFFLGTMLLVLFAVKFPLFPVSSNIPPGVGLLTVHGVAEVTRRLALPFITLTLAGLAPYFLTTRSSMLGALGEDYVLMARAKGCPTKRVVRHHALRNALLPVSTLFSLNLGFVLGGAVVVETVFSYPGMGRLTYDAVLARDFPMLQGTFLVFTVAVVAANALADLTYPLLDPRVRTGRPSQGHAVDEALAS